MGLAIRRKNARIEVVQHTEVVRLGKTFKSRKIRGSYSNIIYLKLPRMGNIYFFIIN